ncbi:MAG TPA: DUF1634 domain-containing protein [Verrucomicrobiae bacterium]|jgi:uncharacterized membrane protein|nr:DUF1634 domain-containing protein [Verrucomicrobiae bacterium]
MADSREDFELAERRTEERLGLLLRTGVAAAAALVLAGGILYLLHYGGMRSDYANFRGEPEDLRTLSGIMKDAFSGRRRGLIQLGLIVLMATPVCRVAFSVFAFWKQRDTLYTCITLAVLILLACSLFPF